MWDRTIGRGFDRRYRQSLAGRGTNTGQYAELAVAALLVLLIPLWSRLVDLGSDPISGPVVVLTLAAAVGLLALGFMLVLIWRLTGRREAALLGIAVVLAGFFLAPSRSFVPPNAAVAASDDYAFVRVLLAATAAALVAAAVSGSDAGAKLRMRRLVGIGLPALLAGSAAIIVLAELFRRAGFTEQAVAANVADVVSTIVWGAAAVSLLAAARRQHSATAHRLGTALALLAASWLTHTDLIAGQPRAFANALLAVAAAGFAAYAVLPEQHRALLSRDRSDAASRARWESAEGALEAFRKEQAEARHQIASALAGIAAANTALEHHRDALEPSEAAQLSESVSKEVARLQAFVVSSLQPVGAAYDAADVLRPVVAAERAAGRDVTLVGAMSAGARGRPHALAEMARTLLDNAAVHAPGAAVRIRLLAGDMLRVVVEDDGPGFPPGCEDVAFHRGWQGGTAGGSGLGLYLIRRIAGEEGGAARVARDLACRGGAVVVDLPGAALPAPAVPEPHAPHASGHELAWAWVGSPR